MSVTTLPDRPTVSADREVPSLPPSRTSRVSHQANQPTTTPATEPTTSTSAGGQPGAVGGRGAEAEGRDEPAEHRGGEPVTCQGVEGTPERGLEVVADHEREHDEPEADEAQDEEHGHVFSEQVAVGLRIVSGRGCGTSEGPSPPRHRRLDFKST